MEIRLHGRGGQGGVTCAKILAAVYARLGKSVQTFGDYAGERSGAPVRAFLRVDDQPITNRNKVYNPDHLIVLDATLLDTGVMTGLAVGGKLLLNTPEGPGRFAVRFARQAVGTVDATAIARRHGIGSTSLVIVNTTIAGAFVRVFDLPLEALESTYRAFGLHRDFAAACEAYEAVQILDPTLSDEPETLPTDSTDHREVVALTAHRQGPTTGLKTGSWRTQRPRYVLHLAPCSGWCPAGNDVIGFVNALGNTSAADAAEILGRTNPLAAVCGRVCPAPCMLACNRTDGDGAVNVRGLERWVSDHTSGAWPQIDRTATPRRIAVVGSGPAGLSAAYQLARRGNTVTIFEREAELGGILRTGIPAFRLSRQVLDKEIGQVLELGVEIRCCESIDHARLSRMALEFDAVVLASGLQRLASLDVPGIDLDGIAQGIDFLHAVNVGGDASISGAVVVLGGGNTALDCARSALRTGATSATVVYRRTRSEMPAIGEEIDEASDEGVRFLYQRQPLQFQGNGRLQTITLADVELGEPDASGRRRPLVTERTSEIACDHVLLALGQFADRRILPAGWELTERRLHCDGIPLNVFAAGDLATQDGTVAHAIGDGHRAATEALAALGEDIAVFERPDRTCAVPLSAVRPGHLPPRKPAADRLTDPEERVLDFREVNRGLGDPSEAFRCLSCGTCTYCDTCLVYCPEGIIHRKEDEPGYEIDLDFCKGCGICAVECPRGAMEMVEG